MSLQAESSGNGWSYIIRKCTAAVGFEPPSKRLMPAQQPRFQSTLTFYELFHLFADDILSEQHNQCRK